MAGVGVLLALFWAWLTTGLLLPDTLWIPGTDKTVLMAAVEVMRGTLFMLFLTLGRPLMAFGADRLVARENRHGPALIAGAGAFALAWLVAPHVLSARGATAATTIAIELGHMLMAASVAGIAVSAGRRLGALGVFAGVSTVAAAAAPGLRGVTPSSIGVATAIPVVLLVSLIVLAWPRHPTALLGSPAERDARERRPEGYGRAFWLVVLVTFLAWPARIEPHLQRHLRDLGDVAPETFRVAWQWSSLGAGALYALLSRRFPLRLLLPGALVLSALGTLPLTSMTAEHSLTLAGAVFGATHTLLYASLVHLAMEASPRGREAWTFTMLRLVAGVASSATFPLLEVIGLPSNRSVPLVASAGALLAVAALWFVPRRLLGDSPVARS